MDKLCLSNNALGSYAEVKRVEAQNWTAETGQTGHTGGRDRSDRSLPENSGTRLQKLNLEQMKFKSNETWRISSQLFREYIPKRSFPKD